MTKIIQACMITVVIVLATSDVSAQERPRENQIRDTDSRPELSEENYAIASSCPGWSDCYGTCRDNHAEALDACEYLDYVGFGTYCRVRAARHFSDCSNICTIDCAAYT
jgi:hypothetical protein